MPKPRKPRVAVPPKHTPSGPYWIRLDVTDVTPERCRDLYSATMSGSSKADLYLAVADTFVKAAKAEISYLEQRRGLKKRRRA